MPAQLRISVMTIKTFVTQLRQNHNQIISESFYDDAVRSRLWPQPALYMPASCDRLLWRKLECHFQSCGRPQRCSVNTCCFQLQNIIYSIQSCQGRVWKIAGKLSARGLIGKYLLWLQIRPRIAIDKKNSKNISLVHDENEIRRNRGGTNELFL